MSDHEKHLAMLEEVTKSHIVLIEALLRQAQALIQITRQSPTAIKMPGYAPHMKLTKRPEGE